MSSKFGMNEKGFTLAGALSMIAVMSIFMGLAVQLWSTIKQRNDEEELIFRGQEYVEAVSRYHAKFHTYPPDIETLLKLKLLRREYKDPMTESGKWKLLHPDSLVTAGAAGLIGGTNLTAGGKEGDKKDGNPLVGADKDKEKENDPFGSGDEEEEELGEEEPESETTGPIVGVVSRSRKTSFKLFNDQTTYNKWLFVYATPQAQQPVVPPPGTPPPGTQPPKTEGNPPPKKP